MTETYEGLNFNGLERRGNYRLIGFREDMLYVLDKKDAAAIIYHIIYRWLTEYRPKDVHKEMERRKKAGERPMTQEEVDDMMWVYMSYNDFVKESGGAVGYNTVIRTLDYLINIKKVFKQRPNHDPRFPDYEYTIDKEVVRKLLKALPVFPPFIAKGSKKPSTHLGTVQEDPTQMGTPSDDGSTQTGIPSTQTGTEATQMGTILYPNGGTSQYYTDNTQITSQESTLPTLAATPTSSSHDEDAHALSLSSKPERISHEQTMVPHGRGTQERLELPGSRTDHSDTRNNATLPDPMHHHLSPHLQPAQYAHRTLERTPTHDAHALSLSSEQERKTDVYTDRALVCHSLANGQSVHPHTESPATAGVSPALGGNDPSPAQMVAKEQASPLASGTQRIGHASSTSPSCSLCSEQEDIQPCQQCGTRLCFEHRRDFPSETEPTHILCVECLRQHNRAMVETPSANTELVSALGPVSEKAEPLIASTTPTSQPAPPKAARKPRAARKPKTPLQDLDEETQARVVKVLDCLDSWRQETSGNPDQCYSREDPQAIAAIVKILPLKPTPKRLRQVCDAMWNTPRDQRTGFHWQKHMTVVNICKQYDTQSLELDAKEKKATQYTNISILPVTPVKDDDDDNLVFLGPRSQRTQMRKRG